MGKWSLLNARLGLLNRGAAQTLGLTQPALLGSDERQLREEPGADHPRLIVFSGAKDPKTAPTPPYGPGQLPMPVGGPHMT
jgi:hypothetical protein